MTEEQPSEQQLERCIQKAVELRSSIAINKADGGFRPVAMGVIESRCWIGFCCLGLVAIWFLKISNFHHYQSRCHQHSQTSYHYYPPRCFPANNYTFGSISCKVESLFLKAYYRANHIQPHLVSSCQLTDFAAVERINIVLSSTLHFDSPNFFIL